MVEHLFLIKKISSRKYYNYKTITGSMGNNSRLIIGRETKFIIPLHLITFLHLIIQAISRVRN